MQGVECLPETIQKIASSVSKPTAASPVKSCNDGQKPKHKSRLFEYRDKVFGLASKLPMASRLFKPVLRRSKDQSARKGASDEALQGLKVYPSKTSSKVSFSFSGRSWLVFYELGVAQTLRDHVKQHILDECVFLGASSGALVAAAMALDLDLQYTKNVMKERALAASKRLFGPISGMSRVLKNSLQEILPRSVSGLSDRLRISLTDAFTLEPVTSNRFESKEDLIDHILASCYIPLLYETPTRVRGHLYIDGTLSDETPIIDELTVTSSPTSPKANISPATGRYQSISQYFPSTDAKAIEQMFEDGKRDALKWLCDAVEEGNLTSLLFRKFPKMP